MSQPFPLSGRLAPRGTWLVASLAIGLLGPACGGTPTGRPPLYPARGRVLFGDKPLGGALVVLVAEATPGGPGPEVPPPSATTDDDGTFVLSTYDPADGAPAGDYRVKVSTAPVSGVDRGILEKRARAVDVLKGRYMDPATTGLKASIRPGENDVPLVLK